MNSILQQINAAVTLLRAGRLVAMPTETVYGLAADARNPLALAKIFAAKGRPADHPLIVHLADSGGLPGWAREIPPEVPRLVEAFWPGPLTLILKKQPGVQDLVTGGQETVGLRVPAHPLARALLQAFGGGLAAPSANRFGRISPTTAAAVRAELGEQVDLILDGGQCTKGIESTILDLSGNAPRILRPGVITAQQIATVLGRPVESTKNRQEIVPRVSGALASHYAPETPVRLLSAVEVDALLADKMGDAGQQIALVSVERRSVFSSVPVHQVCLSADPEKYAHDLYAVLRELDQQQFSVILIEQVPATVEWDAVRDRLLRASG